MKVVFARLFLMLALSMLISSSCFALPAGSKMSYACDRNFSGRVLTSSPTFSTRRACLDGLTRVGGPNFVEYRGELTGCPYPDKGPNAVSCYPQVIDSTSYDCFMISADVWIFSEVYRSVETYAVDSLFSQRFGCISTFYTSAYSDAIYSSYNTSQPQMQATYVTHSLSLSGGYMEVHERMLEYGYTVLDTIKYPMSGYDKWYTIGYLPPPMNIFPTSIESSRLPAISDPWVVSPSFKTILPNQ